MGYWHPHPEARVCAWPSWKDKLLLLSKFVSSVHAAKSLPLPHGHLPACHIAGTGCTCSQQRVLLPSLQQVCDRILIESRSDRLIDASPALASFERSLRG